MILQAFNMPLTQQTSSWYISFFCFSLNFLCHTHLCVVMRGRIFDSPDSIFQYFEFLQNFSFSA